MAIVLAKLIFLGVLISIALQVIILIKLYKKKENYCVDITGGFGGYDCARERAHTTTLV